MAYTQSALAPPATGEGLTARDRAEGFGAAEADGEFDTVEGANEEDAVVQVG